MAAEDRKAAVNNHQKPGTTGTWRKRQGNKENRKVTSGVPILRFGKNVIIRYCQNYP
jgi:hypothetical protein